MYENLVSRLDREKDKRKRLHQALLDNITRQGTEMVSGRAVPYSPWTGLSQIGKAMIARKGLDESKAATDSLNEQFTEEKARANQDVIEQFMGREGGMPTYSDGTQAEGPPAPTVAPDPTGAFMASAASPYTEGQAPVIKAMLDAKTRGNRGAFSRNIDIYDEAGNVIDTKILDTRGTPGDNIYNVDGTKYTGRGTSPKSPNARAAVIKAEKTAEHTAKREFNMTGINQTIDLADSVLSGMETGKQPTESGIGALYDAVSGVFGHTPDGATEAQTMRALGGALTAKMPRMEGPQSDKDVILYREMAAVIGDATVSVLRRRAALKTVKDLWAKYEHLQSDYNKIPRTDTPKEDPLGIR